MNICSRAANGSWVGGYSYLTQNTAQRYEDQNDHDALRSDAVFKLLAGHSPEDEELASQSTLSRFENFVTPHSLIRLEEWFIDRFVNSFAEPSHEVTLAIRLST
jgi:hypothetical protein